MSREAAHHRNRESARPSRKRWFYWRRSHENGSTLWILCGQDRSIPLVFDVGGGKVRLDLECNPIRGQSVVTREGDPQDSRDEIAYRLRRARRLLKRRCNMKP